MKKVLAILLAGITLCPATLCMAAAPDYTGDWYLTVMNDSGDEYAVADLGIEVTMTLNEDETCLWISSEEEEPTEGTWCTIENGISVTIDGDTMNCVIDEDSIVMDGGEDFTMTFGREKPVAFAPAEAVAVQDISEFDGTWEAEMINMDGTYLSVSLVMDELEQMLGMKTTTITITNGVAEIFGAEDTQEFPLVDGALFIDEEEMEGLDEGVMDQKIELLEDGSIAYTELNVTFYCNPVVSE